MNSKQRSGRGSRHDQDDNVEDDEFEDDDSGDADEDEFDDDEDEFDEDDAGEDEFDDDEDDSEFDEGTDEEDNEEKKDEADDSSHADAREGDEETDDEDDEDDNAVSLEFTGSVSEYFRIWVVNLCLSIVTLGVFSAWAKVRRQRYLYASARLDGSPFEYVGRPIPILKGRLIAATLAGAWYATRQIKPTLSLYVLLLAALLSPWIIAKSMAFRTNATAFRNIRLSFTGSVLMAVRLIYGWLLVVAILASAVYWSLGLSVAGTLGLFAAAALAIGAGYVFLEQSIRRYLVANTWFGDMRGKFKVTVKDFFVLYVKAFLVTLGAGIPLSIVLTSARESVGMVSLVLQVLIPYISLGVFYTYKQASIFNLCWRKTSFGGLYFRSNVSFWELLKLYTLNILGILVSLGLLIPWATIRTVRYRITHTRAYIDGDFDQFEVMAAPGVNAIGAEIADTFDMDLAF
jgi:uncharacterized membrane protein YjgN (DUF898 family)